MDHEQQRDVALLAAVVRAYATFLGVAGAGLAVGAAVAVLVFGWVPGHG